MSESSPAALKEWFNESRYRAIARELSAVAPGFERKRFLDSVLGGLNDRSLMERVHQCATSVEAALPGSYRQKVGRLERLAPAIRHEFVAIFLADFVATFGLGDFDYSLEALRRFTIYGTAEFAVRPFLVADQARALAVMRGWTGDADEKVRRLASEGSRPRLPWGMRLGSLIRDPAPTGPILEALKNDPSLTVRRSVANHLNDITKDHASAVVDRLSGWDLQRAPLRWIAKHACRTLIKRGHSGALSLFGFSRPQSTLAGLQTAPKKIRLGDRLTLKASIRTESTRSQRLVIDYVIHYVKAGGGTSAKVFKWTEIELAPHSGIQLTKSQLIRDFSTRRHYPGRHRVELQINGTRLAESAFQLDPPDGPARPSVKRD